VKSFFIIVPALNPTGPVKGAIALANGIISDREVVIVSVKKSSEKSTLLKELNSRVKHICLNELSSNYLGKIKEYQKILKIAGSREKVASISYCFSADLINLFCKKHSLTCSSLRGDIEVNYRHDYGRISILLTYFHFFILRWFDIVVAMNNSMFQQIKSKSGVEPVIICNFINEIPYKNFPSTLNITKPLSFVFVGTLSSRKKPMLLLKALSKLHNKGEMAILNIIGSGPMFQILELEIERLKLKNYVNLYGFLNNPLKIIVDADVMVLPSLAEGTPRAALEALYFGIPCVLRNTGGNGELISEGKNGALFNHDSELVDAMIRAVTLSQREVERKSLLPENFGQNYAAKQYIEFLECNND